MSDPATDMFRHESLSALGPSDTDWAGAKAARLGVLSQAGFNIPGGKILLVWASFWSDRALLYRQELGLDPQHSRIAVIVQSFLAGVASGVDNNLPAQVYIHSRM
jgi:phosphoenolpyruvate synthase/pyruvate phosphate dikinase